MNFPRFRHPFALFALLISCLPAAAQTTSNTRGDAATQVAVGRWTARFRDGGLFLDYDGIPVLRGGLVQLFSPDYSHGYYGSGSNPPDATVETLPDGGWRYTARFLYSAEGRSLDATQRIEVYPEGRVVFALRARWHAPEPALLEWNPIRLWAYPLIGAAYTAKPAQGDGVTGRIGYRPLHGSYPSTRLSPPFKTLSLTGTAVGDLTLTADAGEPPVLYDGREDPYLQDDRLFWGGCPGQTLRPDQEVEDVITLTVTPKAPAPGTPPTVAPAPLADANVNVGSRAAPVAVGGAEAPPAHLLAERIDLPDAAVGLPALADAQGHPVLIPQPKSARFTGADLVLSGPFNVIADLPHGAEGDRVRAALGDLTALLRRQRGVRIVIGRERWSGGRSLRVVVKGSAQGSGTGLPAPPAKAEGYALRVGPTGAVVVGHDAAGAFYGLQTLRQLLKSRPDGRTALVGVEIADWPSLPFRGVHLFVGRHALPFHSRLIDRVLARYKLNKLVIECEYTAWKSHPEIHVPYSMPPEDLRKEIGVARDHFMEPIPLIASLGHSAWIFKNGQHLDFAEDTRAPHAYDASNPATYRFLFDIYREAIDLFHPRLFHIGHDEVKIPNFNGFGRYPARPENVKKGVTRLFVDDTRRLADWLHARGARPMLWGDMLLNEHDGTPLPGRPTLTAANAPTAEEARLRRAGMPKDAVVCDWRYEAGSEQRNGLQVLIRAGFDAIGCAWYEPENIRGWAQQAIRNGALGTLQTTWAGYDSNEGLLDTEARQFTAFVLAAEYAWSGSALHPRPDRDSHLQGPSTIPLLPYSAADVFARSYRDPLPPGAKRAGWALDLYDVADIRLQTPISDEAPWTTVTQAALDSDAGPLSGATTATLRRALLQDAQTGLTFTPPRLGLMLRSALTPTIGTQPAPTNVSLPVHARAGELAFLHATAYGASAGAQVATYTVIYADGRRIEIPVRYGDEIRALDDPTPSSAFSVSTVPWAQGNIALTLRLQRWLNLRPQVEIAAIEFRADDPQAAPVLFGVTGVE